MRLWLAAVLICLFGGGCVSAPKGAAPQSQNTNPEEKIICAEPPSWAGKNWREGGKMFFSGISAPCGDIACAKEGAYNNAAASLVSYLGVSVSSETESYLDNNAQYINAKFTASSGEIPLRHIKAEEFKSTSSGGKFTGYILISLEENEIKAALAEADRLKEEEKAKRLARRKIGKISVARPSQWADLAAAFESFLNGAGYIIGENGEKVSLREIAFSCSKSRFGEIQICALQAKIVFKERAMVYGTRGFGLDKEKARKDAVRAWISLLPQDILEEK